MSWFRRRLVTRGRPPAGGSGCHIWWEQLPEGPMVEFAATLEVVRAPNSPYVSFWALQATFASPNGDVGAAHTGLQWNPRHPGGRAVNWGGYHQPTSELRQLSGTAPTLPGLPSDPNTRDYPWKEGRRYRFSIHRGARGWAASVTDGTTGESTTLRELLVEADRLIGAVVWAELFGSCDDPAHSVRWSDFQARRPDGEWVRPAAARLNVPAAGTGACDNMDALYDGAGGFVISTGVARTAPDTALHRLG